MLRLHRAEECTQMMFAGAGLCGISVIPRNDSAQPLFPLDLTPVRGLEVWTKNLVPDIRTLMRSLIVVVRQPLPVDVVELVKAHANKVVQTFLLEHADAAFRIRVGLRSPYRSFDTFDLFALPERPEPFTVFRIPVMNKVPDLNAQILKPHGGITGLLKHPVLRGIERGRAHENLPGSKMDENKDIGINPSPQRKNRFGEKVARGQRLHVRSDKLFPIPRGISLGLVGNRMVPLPFKDLLNRRATDADAELLQLTQNPGVTPTKVFPSHSHHQIHGGLRRSRTTGYSLFPVGITLSQPAPVGGWFHDHHDVLDIMLNLFPKPKQLRPLAFRWDNSGVFDTISQHSKLIVQKLQFYIIPWFKHVREKDKKSPENPGIIPHIRLCPMKLKSILSSKLRDVIHFRTPRKKLKRGEGAPAGRSG